MLHLGNVQFAEDLTGPTPALSVSNAAVLRIAGRLLKLPPSTFTNSLIQTRATVGGQVVEAYKSKAVAQADIETLMQGFVVFSMLHSSQCTLSRAVHGCIVPDS